MAGTAGNASATSPGPHRPPTAVSRDRLRHHPLHRDDGPDAVDVGDVLTDDVTGLTNGTAYTFTVAATNSPAPGRRPPPPTPSPRRPCPAHPPTSWRPPATPAPRSPGSPRPPTAGSAITGYVITPYIGTTAQTPVDVGDVLTDDVTGLTNGTAYTFTVAATNAAGTGDVSDGSNSVTPVTVPGAPTAVAGTAGKGSVKLTWKAPASTGGAAITGYLIKPSTGASVRVADVLTRTLTGLTNGTAYTFTVSAIDVAGTGEASARSKAVTPDGLYIVTKTLAKATHGKKYTAVTLTEKNGVGTETWTAAGLPAGLKLSTAGVLSGTVSRTAAIKSYTITITVKDSAKPTKQTATAKLTLVVS